MVSVYVAIIILAAFAVMEPLLMLLTSKFIRRGSRPNSVKDNSYESAESSSGGRTSVMNEYLHYFPMFLSFEVIAAIMLMWILSARALPAVANYYILGLFVSGFIFEMFIIIFAREAQV